MESDVSRGSGSVGVVGKENGMFHDVMLRGLTAYKSRNDELVLGFRSCFEGVENEQREAWSSRMFFLNTTLGRRYCELQPTRAGDVPNLTSNMRFAPAIIPGRDSSLFMPGRVEPDPGYVAGGGGNVLAVQFLTKEICHSCFLSMGGESGDYVVVSKENPSVLFFRDTRLATEPPESRYNMKLDIIYERQLSREAVECIQKKNAAEVLQYYQSYGVDHVLEAIELLAIRFVGGDVENDKRWLGVLLLANEASLNDVLKVFAGIHNHENLESIYAECFSTECTFFRDRDEQYEFCLRFSCQRKDEQHLSRLFQLLAGGEFGALEDSYEAVVDASDFNPDVLLAAARAIREEKEKRIMLAREEEEAVMAEGMGVGSGEEVDQLRKSMSKMQREIEDLRRQLLEAQRSMPDYVDRPGSSDDDEAQREDPGYCSLM